MSRETPGSGKLPEMLVLAQPGLAMCLDLAPGKRSVLMVPGEAPCEVSFGWPGHYHVSVDALVPTNLLRRLPCILLVVAADDAEGWLAQTPAEVSAFVGKVLAEIRGVLAMEQLAPVGNGGRGYDA